METAQVLALCGLILGYGIIVFNLIVAKNPELKSAIKRFFLKGERNENTNRIR